MSKLILLSLWLPPLALSSFAFGASEQDVRKLEDQDRDAWVTSDNQPAENPAPQESAPATTDPTRKELKLESKIRPIEAEEFPVKLVRRSTTGRVLLLEDPTNNEPRPGKVLLLKQGETDILALRVLKNRQGRFIGKIVLKFSEPNPGAEYRAIKKIGDKIMQEIRQRQKLGLDDAIRDEELAKEIDPNDVELDRGIPTPKKKPKKPKEKDLPLDSLEISEDDLADHNVDFSRTEETDLEPHKHALTMQLAFMSNRTAEDTHKRYTAIGFRYAYSPFRKMFFSKPDLQDMLTAEASIFIYKISGYELPNDEITVIPVIGTLRYNLLIGEYVTTYIYGGALRNNVTVNSGGESEKTDLLKGSKLAAGVGAQLKLGPGWAVRADFGFDLWGIGAVLKF